MNYLIKTTIFLLLSILLPSSFLFCQDSLVIVTGSHEWYEKPTKTILEFDFVENGTTCGPNAQFETIEEQFAYLKYDLLKNNQMAQNIEETLSMKNFQSRNPKKTFSFEYRSREEAKLLMEKSKEAFAENYIFYGFFEKKKFEFYNQMAASALENAFEKAIKIAKQKGFNEVSLVSVEDKYRWQFNSNYTGKVALNQNLTEKGILKKYGLIATFKMISKK